jgi:hypothetical protein
MADPTSNDRPKGALRARLFAFFALSAFVAGAGYAGTQGYRAATDSFVAPMILSPDNDLVLQTKAKAAELEVERKRLLTELDAIDTDIAASEKAIERLKGLGATVDRALEWTKSLAARQASASWAELQALARQRAVLTEMAAKQERISKEATANLDAKLISRTDEAREKLALEHVQLALIENERSRVQHEAALNQAFLAQRSLATARGMMMPEAIAREEQLVRIELEIARLESEQRAKRAEKQIVLTKLEKMDELERQLRGRPVFRAMGRSLEVAFVPYTQSEGVVTGAVVYDCVWGVFACKPVGTITEVVPGEVILPDPWGNPARGQYAVLDLSDHGAAKSKVLRVRRGTSEPIPPAEPSDAHVASVR